MAGSQWPTLPTNNYRLVVDCRFTVALPTCGERLADSSRPTANIANHHQTVGYLFASQPTNSQRLVVCCGTNTELCHQQANGLLMLAVIGQHCQLITNGWVLVVRLL